MTDDPLEYNLDLAVDKLRQVASDLERFRRDLRTARTLGALKGNVLRAERDFLLVLGSSLNLGAVGIHGAAQILSEQLGETAPEFVEWLTGVVVAPPEPTAEAAQAQALLAWLMLQLESAPSRVRTALGRDLQRIIAGEGGALAGLDSAGLLAELRRPSGGRVGKVAGLGSAGLVLLRLALGVEGG